MAKEYIDYKETIELFVYSLPSELKNESKTPRINIIFPESAFKLFEYVRDNPFTKEGYIVPDITDKDIKKLKYYNQQDENAPTIYVKNPVRFFELLTELINTIFGMIILLEENSYHLVTTMEHLKIFKYYLVKNTMPVIVKQVRKYHLLYMMKNIRMKTFKHFQVFFMA